MSAASWQIQVGDDLSKQYTVEQLRRKRTNGVISDDVMCTRDRGATFLSLASLLDEEERPRNGSVRKLGKINRVSRLKPTVPKAKSVTTETADSGLHPPSSSSSGIQPTSSVSAIFRAPKTPVQPKDAEPLLDVLIADAANAAPENEVDEEPRDDAEAETYKIPAPPPPRRRPMTFPESAAPAPAAIPASPVAEAAAAMLQSQEKEEDSLPARTPPIRPGQRPRPRRDSSEPEFSDDVIPVFGDVPDPKPSLLRRPLALLTIALGLAAVGIMIVWQKGGDGPPRFEELTGASFDFNSDSPATLEELHARTQILGVRVGQIQRALTNGNGDVDGPESVVIPELPEIPRMPFVPFQQRSLSEDEQRKADDLLQKYSTLVQNGGPDGRQHDKATVSTYTEYLKELISNVDSRGASRSDVLHELSELTKLIYLLQLKNIRDGDALARQTASKHLLDAANQGLSQIYSELATGDMRFADVFEREEASQRARLLLARYWHHRSVNRETAEQWLNASLELIDDDQRDYVKSSIAEVSQIEK